MIQIFGTPKCKTTRAAQRFFADRRIEVHFIDLREQKMSKGELTSVASSVGGMRALYDAEGVRAKERGLAHTLLDDERILQLLFHDPMLLRTPIVRSGRRAAVGAAEAVWKTFAEAEKAR